MNLKKVFSLLGLFGVVLSAFGSHYLESRFTNGQMHIWTLASFYLFIHVLAGLLSCYFSTKKRSSLFFCGGTIFFSGSLYTLSALGWKFLGFITPVGGLFFILGWLFLFIDLK